MAGDGVREGECERTLDEQLLKEDGDREDEHESALVPLEHDDGLEWVPLPSRFTRLPRPFKPERVVRNADNERRRLRAVPPSLVWRELERLELRTVKPDRPRKELSRR